MYSRIRRIGYLFVVCILCMAAVQHVEAAGLKYRSGKKYKEYTGKKYTIYFEGNKISTDTRYGIKVGDSILVPYRKIVCDSAFKVSSVQGKYRKFLILGFKKNGKMVRFVLNQKFMLVNAQRKTIKVAPRYCKFGKKKVIFVPIKELAESLGYTCKVYKEGNKVSIYKPQQKKKTVKKAVKKTAKKKTVKKTAAKKTTVKAKKTTGVKLPTAAANVQSRIFKSMTPYQFIQKMGPIVRADYKKTGILASVSLAQAINESGWGRTTLCQASNNMFGMKCSLSGNTWSGSVWDQRSYVAIRTTEEYGGRKVKITAKFRKYPNVAKSVADHSAYLRFARDGSGYRYAGITATKSYVRQLRIIQRGGYCTWSSYISELTSIIRKYNLTKWDR